MHHVPNELFILMMVNTALILCPLLTDLLLIHVTAKLLLIRERRLQALIIVAARQFRHAFSSLFL